MAAPQLSRQQRRKFRRDSIERGRKILARGLGPDLGEDEAVGIVLILHECLTDAARPRRASEAAELVETLLEKSLPADIRGLELGCRKGCSFCCSALVTCSAPEIFRVAHWLAEHATTAAAPIKLADITAEATRRDALTQTPEQRFLERAPCPLLVSNACGVYAVRPIPCRALYSLSSEACRIALQDNAGEVPIIVAAMQKGETARTLLLAALNAAGLSDRGIELTAGVMAVIGRPDAEARWLAGENVFDGVLGAERTPGSRRAQDYIAKLVKTIVD